MSSLRKDDILAVLLSDIHLSEKAPIARSAEPDWMRAQARPLQEIGRLAKGLGCPILAAGDIFDKWNPSPSLINWAIDTLPKMYAVPGQHDLRHHNYDDLEMTAYWTLHAAGAIVDLGNRRSEIEPVCPLKKPYFVVYPFPWGVELGPCEYEKKKGTIDLALVHKYIWSSKADSYPNADPSSKIINIMPKLKGYTVAAFGDNHRGCIWTCDRSGQRWTNDCNIINCGTLMRRKADEIDYKPQVGLLMSDGTIRPYYLDCSQDKFIDMAAAVELVEQSLDMTEFLDELRRLGDKGLDFVTAVKRFCKDNNINRGAVKAILQAIEK